MSIFFNYFFFSSFFLVLFFPFFVFFVGSLFGFCLGSSGFIFICLLFNFLAVFICFLFFLVFFFYGDLSLLVFDFGNWVFTSEFQIGWSFVGDGLSVLMSGVVLFISFLVQVYSLGYMNNDPHLIRFFSYLSLFTFFMLVLVNSGNFLVFFLGWEGVGLSSYLLISFWCTRLEATRSAVKAVAINRLGDLSFFAGIIFVLLSFHSLDFFIVFELMEVSYLKDFTFFGITVNSVSIISFLFFIGVMAKSAQIGLHTWLPDAMEGPTPVSALIHAATMVTAGVYLLIRCSVIFSSSEFVSSFILIIGALTAFFASSVASFQNDIKKIVAYSTCSQLGYMVMACGIGAYAFAFFHLAMHAFFKALLFLGCGSVIHSCNDEQDIRRMGGLVSFLPFTYLTFLIGSLSLSGFPFLSGFYSKDAILEVLSIYLFRSDVIFAYFLAVLSVFMTSFYSFRLLYFVFLSVPRMSYVQLLNMRESSFLILFPMFILCAASIFMGYFLKDLFIGFNSPLFLLVNGYIDYTALENISLFFRVIPLFLSLFGIVSGLFFFFFYSSIYSFFLGFCKLRLSLKIPSEYYLIYFFVGFHRFFARKWYFDFLYNSVLAAFVFKLSFLLNMFLERGLLEYFGSLGIWFFISRIKESIRAESGYIYNYIYLIITFIFVALILVGLYLFGFYEIFLILILSSFFFWGYKRWCK